MTHLSSGGSGEGVRGLAGGRIGNVPNRILKESICISDNLNELSAEAERLFYRILVNCDDYGRMEAHPKIIRAKCFPRQIDTITDADAIIWLQALAIARLITFYEVSGQRYLFCTTWEKHQQIRAKRSKYPNPPSSDINCNQPQANVPVIQSNPIQSNHQADDINCKQVPPLDEKLAKAYSLWENNMGPLGSIVSQRIADALQEYGLPAFENAVQRTVDRKGKGAPWVYFIKVLANHNEVKPRAKAPPDYRDVLRQEKENARA